MIESFLYAVLGFLVATGLAIAIAPTLWRRAERLERKRIEASLPLSRPEQEAAIDAVRAESAMSIRRLEIKLKALGQKNTQILVESDALQQRLRALHDETDTSDRLVEVRQQLTDRESEVQTLSRINDDLNMTISTLKMDLVASEAEIERLNNGLTLLRTQRREADRIACEAIAEKVEVVNARRVEQIQMENLPGASIHPLLETSEDSAMISQMQQRIADLTSTYSKRPRNASAAKKNQQDLREEISAIAAQMVLMVAKREGPNSAIDKALSEPVHAVPGVHTDLRPESLADRVQSLRKN